MTAFEGICFTVFAVMILALLVALSGVFKIGDSTDKNMRESRDVNT